MPRRAFLIAVLWPLASHAQAVVFDGALSSIKINRYSSLCSGQQDPAVEVLPAAATTTVKFEQSCKGSSVKLEFTLNLELKTAAAKQVSSYEIEFEEGVRGSYSASAVFAHPKASGSVLKFEMPARDLDPSSGFPVSAGTCTEPIQNWPGGGGEWTRSLSIPECTRNKRQFISKNADGSYSFQTWTEIHAYLWADKDSTADSIAFGMEAVMIYRLTPNLEKVRITSITPAAGERQDPNGKFRDPFGADATVQYELVSQDEADIALVALDFKNEARLGASDPKRVKKGTGTVQLRLSPFAIKKSSEEIQIGAVLGRVDREELLAESEPVKYPVHVELSIPHVEVFQVVQDENNSIPWVANRHTVLNVPLLAEALNPRGGDGITMKIRARRNGKEIEESPYLPDASGWGADTAVERFYIGNAKFWLPLSWTSPGRVDLELEVNPAGPDHLTEHNASNNKHSLTVEFEERPSLNIQYIHVCVEAPGEAAACPEGSVSATDDLAFVRGLFPVAPTKLGYDPVSPSKLTWKKPMVTVADWDQLLVAMQALVERSNSGGKAIDQLLVWLPAATRATYEDGKLRALSMNHAHNGTGRVTLVPVQGVEELEGMAAWAVAHELGHNFGLEHGDSPPQCVRTSANAVTGEFNLGFQNRLVFLDKDTYHFMGYCAEAEIGGKALAPIGIQPSQYRQLWQSRFQPWAPASTAVAKQSAAEEIAECALIEGVVQSSGTSGTIDQLTRVNCSAPRTPVAGGYCIRMENSSGAKLDETCFGISFTAPDSSAQMKSRAYFVSVRIPAGTVKVSLNTADGRELASRKASGSAPSVAFVTPRAGDQWNGGSAPLEVKWAASDPDGGPLNFLLDYSSDGGVTWTPLLLPSPSDSSYSLEASRIQGGKKVHFRVTASDGFLQSSATVGPLEIVQTPVVETAAALDFLNAVVTRPAQGKLEVRNTGSGPLTIQSFEAADPFVVVEPAPICIPAGTKRMIAVQFTPAAKGLSEGVLRIKTNDPVKATIDVALSGMGVDMSTPDIEAIPATVSFGNVVNGKSRERTLQIRNRGPADLTLRSIEVTAGASGLFTAAGLSKPVVLKQSESYSVKITFAPRESGSFTGKLVLGSDDPKDGTLEVPLQGSGVTTASAMMRIQPTSLSFGSVTVGAKKDLSVSVSNPGGAPLVVSSLTVTGGSSFTVVSPSAPLTVEAGFDAAVTVRFLPDSAGSKSASLVIAGNDTANPAAVVALSGTGAAANPAPRMEVSPVALSFGEVSTGQSKTLAVVIRNSGDAGLAVAGIASSNARFGIANGVTLPLQVAAGAEVQVGIRFSPTEIRAESGTLTITGNDPARASVTIALTGTGIAPPASPARITVNPASLSFGSIQVGQSRDLTLTVQNSGTGNAQLQVTAASVTGSVFRLTPEFSAFTLAAGASRTLTVRFLPGAAGDFNETLNLSSNDSSTPVLAVALRGTGQALPPSGNVSISVTPAKLEFGSLLIGQSRSLSFNIVATGTTPLTVTAITSSNPQVRLMSPALPVSTSIVNIIPVTVQLTAATAGALSATLTVASNASNEPALAVPMTATIYAPGTLELAVDDGSFERTMSVGETFATPHYVNRLTPPVYPATIRTVRIYFHDKPDGLEPRTGITVVTGASDSGTENINQTPLAKVAGAVPSTLARWADFAVTPLTIQSGDFVAGFSSANAEVPFTVAVDAGPPAAKRSYTSTDGRTFQLVDAAGKATNFGIRIVVTLGNP